MDAADAQPAHRLIVVLTWPDEWVTWQLAQWINRHFRPDRQWSVCERGWIDIIRCRVAARCLEETPREVTEFVFADRDIRPDHRSDAMLLADGDVVGCQYPTRCPSAGAWDDPHAIHMGLVRVSRRILETLSRERTPAGNPVPLFAIPRSPDNRIAAGCECAWFSRRCRATGFTVRRAGWSDHG